MARYDRIAPLTAPSRSQVFAAWSVLEDLEGRERDNDLGRRARLRFLALRPIRRLIERGIDGVPTESYERQIEGVREELGHLSARDPERAHIANFLHAILDRTPAKLVAATLEMGEVTEDAGHYYAAEEYFLTGLELAEALHLTSPQVAALRMLGRVCRKGARWEDAERYYQRAIELAEQTADQRQWARAMDGLGVAFRYQGNYPKAAKIFREVLARGKEWQDDYVVATAYSSLCYNALTAEDLEHALEYGWTAIRLMEDEEERNPVLGNLGIAFTRLSMFRAAERCYEIIIGRSKKLIVRGKAWSEHAVVAAEAGDSTTFRNRRAALLGNAAEWNHEPWLNAMLHLDLGRGCFLVGDTDFSRDHLRESIATAETHGYSEILIRAEELLTGLEQMAPDVATTRPRTEVSPGDVAKRIAGEVESYQEQVLVAASA